MQPANFQHGYHVDVLENAAKYFDELAVLLVQHFKLEMSVPQPLDWVTARLAQFYREMDILQADREGSPPAKDQSPET